METNFKSLINEVKKLKRENEKLKRIINEISNITTSTQKKMSKIKNDNPPETLTDKDLQG
jgi:hypothetical protein